MHFVPAPRRTDSPTPRGGRPAPFTGRGIAWWWTIVALAVVAAAIVIGFMTWGALQRGPTIGTTGASTPSTGGGFNQAAAQKRIGKLQKQFKAVIQHHRDITPLRGRIAEFVRQNPNYAPGHVLLAQTLLIVGREAQAYDQLQEVLKIEPGNAQAQVLAGSVATQLNRLPAALDHYSQAVGLDKKNPKFHVMLGAAYMREHKGDKARAELLTALNLDSSLHAAHAGLSDLYKQQNKINLALDQIKRALALAPDKDQKSRNVYLRKQASLLMRDNRPAEALAVMRKLPNKLLIDRDVSKELAAVWMQLQRPARAAAHYEQIMSINPAAAWAGRRAVFFRLKAGRVDRAKEDLAMLRRNHPRDPNLSRLTEKVRAASKK